MIIIIIIIVSHTSGLNVQLLVGNDVSVKLHTANYIHRIRCSRGRAVFIPLESIASLRVQNAAATAKDFCLRAGQVE